jgi:hypothetical protein
VIRLTETRVDVTRRLPELRQVLADAESTSGTGHDDRADVGTTGLLQRCCESLVHVGVEGVENVRAVERDREDSAFATRLDLGHREDFRRST